MSDADLYADHYNAFVQQMNALRTPSQLNRGRPSGSAAPATPTRNADATAAAVSSAVAAGHRRSSPSSAAAVAPQSWHGRQTAAKEQRFAERDANADIVQLQVSHMQAMTCSHALTRAHECTFTGPLTLSVTHGVSVRLCRCVCVAVVRSASARNHRSVAAVGRGAQTA
jgi:hypothetical protein